MIPVYLVTGMLDSGKSTLVRETLMEQEWIEEGQTLLILCEEGEIEFPEEYLEEKNIAVEIVEDPEELDASFFKNCDKKYNAAQIVIEYNGMWKLEDLLSTRFPRKWELQGVYSTVNGSTLNMYLKNMKNMLMEPLTESELIIVNRCPQDVDRAAFRRAVKVQNSMATVIFEGLDGQIIPQSEEDLPYDVKKNPIEIDDIDFGIWYVDASENPDLYIDKEIVLNAQAFQPAELGQTMVVLARKIMTCCADDVRFYGYPCVMEEAKEIPEEKWIRVRAKFAYEHFAGYSDPQPVLYMIDMEDAKAPEDDIVYIG